MYHQIKKLSLLASLMLMPSVSLATPYIRGDIGSTAWLGRSPDSSSHSFALGGGYEFSDYFALDAAFMDSGEAVSTGHNSKTTYEYTGYSLNAVLNFPLGDKTSLYGKLGAFAWCLNEKTVFNPMLLENNRRNKTSGNDFIWALGASYALNSAFDVYAELRRHSGIDKTGRGDQLMDAGESTLALGVKWRL